MDSLVSVPSEQESSIQKFWAKVTTAFTPDPVALKIMSFRDLPQGWDYGQGVPIGYSVARKAIEILSLSKLRGFTAEALPMTEGGVVMVLSKGDHFLDVVVNPDLTLDARIEKGIGADYEVLREAENVTKFDVLKLLDDTKRLYLECRLSAHYTKTNTAPLSADSLHSTSSQTAGAFQYSMESVPC